MRDILIRKMNAHEIAQVKELFESEYARTFSRTVPVLDVAAQGEQFFVAIYEGVIVGIVTVWEPTAFLHYLFVDHRMRRKGIGQAMVEYISEQYRRPLTLKCLVENDCGMAFYRAGGWREINSGYSEEGAYSLLMYPKPRTH